MDSAQILARVLAGDTTVRELAGVDDEAMKRMHAIGVSSFIAGRYEQAERIFAGLEALDRQSPAYALHLGHARARLGDVHGAIEALTRFIDADGGGDRIELVRACLVRSMLHLGLGDDQLARDDLGRARLAAGDDPAAKAVLEEIAS
jgi:hypothetical protein